MRAKDCIITFRPNEKLRVYLEQLGLLDGRTGKTSGDGELTKFITKSCLLVLESEMPDFEDHASPEQLKTAWIKHCIRARQAKIDALYTECRIISEKKVAVEVTEP